MTLDVYFGRQVVSAAAAEVLDRYVAPTIVLAAVTVEP